MAGLSILVLAVAVQLLPIPRAALDALSPHTAQVLSAYSLGFGLADEPHCLSIDPAATLLAFAGLVALGTYVVGLPGLLSRRDLQNLPRNLCVFAVGLALIGIYGREHNNGLVYGFWQPLDTNNGNGFGPFINRNHFAGWMLMTLGLTLGWLWGTMERALEKVKPGLRNRLVWLSTSDASRTVLIAASIVVMAISLVWTMSRSGIVSFGCVVASFGWLVTKRHSMSRAKRVGALIFLAIVLAISVGWRGADPLLSWFRDTRDFEGRLAAWRDGSDVIRDFPIFGTGLNTYGTAMFFYQHSNESSHLGSAHNDYVQLLAEGGLLVAVPAAVTVTCLIVTIQRTLKAARHESLEYWTRAGATVGLIGISVQEAADFSLQIPANALLFATLIAIAISPPQGHSRRVIPDRGGHRP